MIYRSVEDILQGIEESHARLLATLNGLSKEQLAFRPAEGRWTIEEIVEHLGIVNGGCLRIAKSLLREAIASGAGVPGEIALSPILLDENGRQSPPVEAPERVRPLGGKPLAESISVLTETIAGYRALQGELESVDLSGAKLTHPFRGPLDALQWAILLTEHQDRHRSQIEATINAFSQATF